MYKPFRGNELKPKTSLGGMDNKYGRFSYFKKIICLVGMAW